jgi:hypothetical protein
VEAIRGDEMGRGVLQLSQLHGHLETVLCDTARTGQTALCLGYVAVGIIRCQTAGRYRERERERERASPLPRGRERASIN